MVLWWRGLDRKTSLCVRCLQETVVYSAVKVYDMCFTQYPIYIRPVYIHIIHTMNTVYAATAAAGCDLLGICD
jgi:hypothetical protein